MAWLRRHRLLLFLLLCAMSAAGLMWAGSEYYMLAPSLRVRRPDHGFWKPGGTWGHALGIVGTVVMLLNFLYYLRKRWRAMAALGPVAVWLDFHVLVGMLGSTIVIFHGAFLFRNAVAVTSLASLMVLVVTGVVGRYIHAQVPLALRASRDHAQRLESLVAAQDHARAAAIGTAIRHEIARLRRRFALDKTLPLGRALGMLPVLLLDDVGRPLRVRRVARLLPPGRARRDMRAALRDCFADERRRALLVAFQSLMPAWRGIHRLFALLMVLTMVVHVGVAWWVGYF